jgi:hypothetical protein
MSHPKEQLLQIHVALAADPVMCLGNLAITNQANIARIQFLRRAYVRAVFAYIEGMVFAMKQFSYEYRIQPESSSTRPELAMLLEESYELNDKGVARTAPAKIPLEKNIKFAFKAFAKAGHSDYELPISDHGWEELKKSTRIRDRLMHPKNANDMSVSEAEHSTVRIAHSWFMNCSTASVGSIRELIKYNLSYPPEETTQ